MMQNSRMGWKVIIEYNVLYERKTKPRTACIASYDCETLILVEVKVLDEG